MPVESNVVAGADNVPKLPSISLHAVEMLFPHPSSPRLFMPTRPPKFLFELEELAARNSKKTLREYEKAKRAFHRHHPEEGNFDDQLSEQFRRVIADLQQERQEVLSKDAQLKRRICRLWAISAAAFDSLFDGDPTPSVRLLNELVTLAKAADFDTALLAMRQTQVWTRPTSPCARPILSCHVHLFVDVRVVERAWGEMAGVSAVLTVTNGNGQVSANLSLACDAYCSVFILSNIKLQRASLGF